MGLGQAKRVTLGTQLFPSYALPDGYRPKSARRPVGLVAVPPTGVACRWQVMPLGVLLSRRSAEIRGLLVWESAACSRSRCAADLGASRRPPWPAGRGPG